MTVITKPLTSEKKPGDKVPLVLPVKADANGLDAEAQGRNGQRLEERYHYILRHRAGRITYPTILFLLIISLLVMTIGLFGGLYIYQQMTRNRIQKWRGWCNVPYLYESPEKMGVPQGLESGKRIDYDGLSDPYGVRNDDAESIPQESFREEFEIDLDEGRYAKLEVPDFKNGRLGRFIHEFDSNKTAIVDQTGKRCFIMPLDRDKILPPKSMYDMIEKMWKGYYSVNTKQVRENMRVVLPALDDLSDLGEYIQQECNDKITYRLEKMTGRVFKRSAEASKELPFTEFTGLFTINYDIVNLQQVEELEKQTRRR